MLTLLFLACASSEGDKTGTTNPGTDLVDADADGYLDTVDCDDGDAAIHPGAADDSVDGVDQDCDDVDGPTDAVDDADGDGYLASVDCDEADPDIHPGADDDTVDGVDQDCDGEDGPTTASPDDADSDGYLASVDCDDDDPSVHPGAEDPAGDGIDQDCDGADDPTAADADGDGYASEAYYGTDCDDGDAAVHPGATETRGDGADSDCDGADFGVAQLRVGDLVITEIMYDPDAVSDADGEWFEVVNASGGEVNLIGLVVADDGAFGSADTFTVEDDLVTSDGDRLVFGVNGDETLNGGIPVDYDFAGRGVNLNNAADDLYLGVTSGGRTTTIDHVSYNELSGWPIAKGFSIELKDTSVDATANDSASAWCLATAIAGSTTDRGSPGDVSSGC